MANTVTPLDPTFVKALRLLQSKSKDSTAQLRAMLDEAIAIRKGNPLPPKPPRSPTSRIESGRSQSRDRIESFENKEVEKRKDLDRLKTDLIQLEPKRPRLESPALSNSSHESVGPGSPQGSEGSQGEFGDLQMNIELDCTCIVCKSFNQESNNKLLECSSCQNLYHQECHEPPVGNFDPRIIWNCSQCTRKASPSRSSSSSRSTSVEKTSKSQEKSSHKSSKSGSSSGSTSHGRPSPAKHGSSSSSSKHKSSHASGSSHTSSSSAGSLQMTEAQKRLKLMKRQAAAASASLTTKKKSK